MPAGLAACRASRSSPRSVGGRHRGDADEVDARARTSPASRSAKTARVPALRVAEHGRRRRRPSDAEQGAGGADAVEHGPPLARADEVRVRARRAEPGVVGDRDDGAGRRAWRRARGPGGMPAPGTRATARSAASTPVVPWAQATTGQPPAGGSPVGATTTPDTAIGEPAGVGRRVQHAPRPAGRPATPSIGLLADDRARPGPSGSSAGGV